MINIAIRSHLFKYLHKNKKGVFISRYLCIASITEMTAHQGVNFFKRHACSGHRLGTNQERYLGLNILALTFTGLYYFNGWVDATPNKLYPIFHCLGPHVTEQAHWLIKYLLIVSVPWSKWYGILYPVRLEATDSMLMYHSSVGTHIFHEN